MKSTSASYGSRTDVGQIRPHNEDSLIVKEPLFAVADGMGGHEAGEVASEIAIETLVAHAPENADVRALGRAVMAANRAVMRASENGVGKPGMGTTMTAVILEKTKLIVAQVGDSRAYLVHGGRLSQITRDHSLMADMIENGEITEEEARWHPQRSIITRALGSDPDMVPDLFDLNLEEGDRVLICSDGLSGMVYNEELAQILTSHVSPQECADALIEAANTNGGHDNITVIVLDITGEEAKLQEKKRARKARIAVIGFVLAFAAIVALGSAGLYAYARSSAYLIAENGYVAVYRGLSGSIGTLSLSWHETTTSIPVDSLPTTTAERVEAGIQVSSLDEAYELVSSYQEDLDDSEADAQTTTVTTTTDSVGANTEDAQNQ